MPKDKATKLTGTAAVVGPTALSATSKAGALNLEVKCPVAGTAWV